MELALRLRSSGGRKFLFALFILALTLAGLSAAAVFVRAGSGVSERPCSSCSPGCMCPKFPGGRCACPQ